MDKWQRVQAIVNQHTSAGEQWHTGNFQKLVTYRVLAENILVFLLQYIGLMFTTLTPQLMPVWFASGTACGFVFLRGYSVLSGIYIASFLAYYLATYPLFTTIVFATLTTLQALLIVWFSRRYITPILLFHSRRTLGKFLVCSGLITALASFLFTKVHPSLHWLTTWLANFNGTLIFGGTLIAIDNYFPQINSLKNINKIWLGVHYGSILALTIAFLITHLPWYILATIPLTLLLRKKNNPCGAIASVFLVSFMISLAISFGIQLTTSILLVTQLSLALSIIFSL